jgi:hypothetical protein
MMRNNVEWNADRKQVTAWSLPGDLYLGLIWSAACVVLSEILFAWIYQQDYFVFCSFVSRSFEHPCFLYAKRKHSQNVCCCILSAGIFDAIRSSAMNHVMHVNIGWCTFLHNEPSPHDADLLWLPQRHRTLSTVFLFGEYILQ